jgi:hypothetical protein
MEERENGRASIQMRKKGLYIAPARNLTITGILTQGQNFCPSSPIKFPPPLQRVAPQLEKKNLTKLHRGGNYRISGLRKFRPRGAEFLAWEKTSIRKQL